ncbi:MAG: DsbA family protein, partial [Halobacteriovoraceae bacterium]|nr:DsbA family protein [Halobacteriovoraceae bacterium]
ELELDLIRLKRDVKSAAVVGLVEDNRLEAISYKIYGTPMMYINGTKLSGSFPYKHVKRTIDGIIETE